MARPMTATTMSRRRYQPRSMGGVSRVSLYLLATASWLFPLYLLLVCLFILPIAAAGLAEAPPGSDPDMFVLTLPMAHGQEALTLLAFLGGFSSATSMARSR